MKSKEIRRVFLGWDSPPVASAAQWLIETHTRGAEVNLASLTVVVASNRGGRRLRERLQQEAEERGVRLSPPSVITSGQLPERLYRPALPLATRLDQSLAWIQVLQAASTEQLGVLHRQTPASDSLPSWFELARILADVCRDLAQDGWTPGDVASEVPTSDRGRWVAIGQLHSEYLRLLHEHGLADPFHERAVAVERGTVAAPGKIVLVATVDLGRQLQRMLRQIGDTVTALIAAPESEHALFDDTGNVIPAAWRGRALAVTREHIVPALDPHDEALRAVSLLADCPLRPGPDDITVGVTDEPQAEIVRNALTDAGSPPRSEIGRPLVLGAPARLLALTRDYLAYRSFDALASLLRHPDVWSQLSQRFDGALDPVAVMDRFRATHFCHSVDAPLPSAALADERFASIPEITAAVDVLLRPLRRGASTLRDWARHLNAFLDGFYGQRTDASRPAAQLRLFDPPDDPSGSVPLDQTLVTMRDRLDRQSRLPEGLDLRCPAGTAIDLLLARLENRRSVEPAAPERIAIAGWLDLLLDDAPAIVVVGFRDAHVPAPVTVDPFLPGRLRARLDVADNGRREARDAFVLEILVRSRPFFRVIAGRLDSEGNPSPPSSLLAACDATENARRVRHLVAPVPAIVPAPQTPWPEASRLRIPPAAAASVRSMSVTYFADYLNCPYRFYLRRVCKLEPIELNPLELAANQFGELVHDTLEAFGCSPLKDSTDVQEIDAYLCDTVVELSQQRYGEAPLPTIRLQTDQAQLRLKEFARRQAERTAEGWRIMHVERAFKIHDGACIHADSGPMPLTGRVDRVDLHEPSGRWQIIDYKTHSHDPMKKHYDQRRGKWKELQLPLYRHFLPLLDIEGPVEFGYFSIAQRPTDTRIRMAELDDSMLASADAEARRVVDSIRAGNFEPNPEAATPYDDYGVICQTSVVRGTAIQPAQGAAS